MNLADVMDALGDSVATIDGLRVYRYAPDSVAVPAAICAYPTDVDYDQAYKRGLDTINTTVVAVVGTIQDRSTRDALAKYCDGAGPQSIKAAIEAHDYGTVCDYAHVSRVEIDTGVIAGVEYLIAIFDVEATGPGATT